MIRFNILNNMRVSANDEVRTAINEMMGEDLLPFVAMWTVLLSSMKN